MTEVHEAAAAGDSALIETLLDTGKYDVNGQDPEWHNRTPIHWAAIKGTVLYMYLHCRPLSYDVTVIK